MLDVLAITSSVFLLIALGYAAVETGSMAKDAMRHLGAYVVAFALPALIFNALAQRSLADIASPGYLAAYGGGSLIAFLLLFLIARWQGKTLTAAAIHAFGGSISNSGFLGYPLVFMALGSVAAVALTLNIFVENMLMLPLALILAESGKKCGGLANIMRGVVLRLVKNPLIIAVCAGAAVSFSGLPLPGPLSKALGMLAGSAAPVALFVIGGTLAELPLKGMFGDAAQIAFTKLFIHPAAVLALLQIVGPLTLDLEKAALIYASLPMASIYPLLAQPYGRAPQAAAALALATSVSFVTISVMLSIV